MREKERLIKLLEAAKFSDYVLYMGEGFELIITEIESRGDVFIFKENEILLDSLYRIEWKDGYFEGIKEAKEYDYLDILGEIYYRVGCDLTLFGSRCGPTLILNEKAYDFNNFKELPNFEGTLSIVKYIHAQSNRTYLFLEEDIKTKLLALNIAHVSRQVKEYKEKQILDNQNRIAEEAEINREREQMIMAASGKSSF